MSLSKTQWVIYYPYKQDDSYIGAYAQDGSYKYGGEHYKVLTENLDNAKKYYSYAKAYYAAQRFMETFINCDTNYEILEVQTINGITTLC